MQSRTGHIILIFGAFCAFFVNLLFVAGCANQQPPSGGDEDKIPPKIHISEPRTGTLNYRGNSIAFDFNEYVDRRSFQDAFRISPQMQGDVEYNWSGTSVEVVFAKPFYKISDNKTFVITINTSLKDIHGNPLTVPFSTAFSTGSKIDEGALAGKVFNNNGKNISIFAYKTESNYDPSKNLADYFSETSPEGEYNLTNMAPGRYRVIAIFDDDRNYLYTLGRESFAVLPYDVTVNENEPLKAVNFYMKQIDFTDSLPELNVSKYFADSLGIVSTSVKNDTRAVLPDQSIYISFNRFKPSRDGFVNNLKVTDENNVSEKMVFNWKNDSLVEVFSANRFGAAKAYNLSFSLKTDKDTLYYFNLKFRVVSNNSFGEMKGSVQVMYRDSSSISTEQPSAKLMLESKDVIPPVKYEFEVRDSVFSLSKILESDYTLFAYIDSKSAGKYNYGSVIPFEHSDPFFIYPSVLSVKGGWVVENVQIIFVK